VKDDLDGKEQKHVRIALRLLRAHAGAWDALARALRCHPKTLQKVLRQVLPVNAGLALRVARFIEMPVEDLLAGKYTPYGTCPHCGRTPDFVDEDTVNE
jgi:hypothetical protein